MSLETIGDYLEVVEHWLEFAGPQVPDTQL